jgi:hypothetical protein
MFFSFLQSESRLSMQPAGCRRQATPCFFLVTWLNPRSSRLKWCFSSETSVNFHRTAWHHIPEDNTLHCHHCKNAEFNRASIRMCRHQIKREVLGCRYEAYWHSDVSIYTLRLVRTITCYTIHGIFSSQVKLSADSDFVLLGRCTLEGSQLRHICNYGMKHFHIRFW